MNLLNVTDNSQQLNILLNSLDDGVRASLNRIEVLTETLRAMFPEFEKVYEKQRVRLQKQDAAQRKQQFSQGQRSARPIVDLLDAVYERKQAL